jgi:A/G-specific adenine glycosylase
MPKSPPAPNVASFAERVVRWQASHGRHDLPWQRTRDAYRIWVSEIMLQQTQVATVLPYYARFLADFPDVRSLAAAPIERVLELWSGLGYYRRAHLMHACAVAVVERHGGEFPADVDALASLPGVGRSTASAIAAFAFGVRAAILEGNVRRVLARHCGVEGWPGEAKVQAKLWALAESRLPDRAIEAYTQGTMDLGATVCTRGRPRCDACPVALDCVALASGRVDELPAPRPRRETPRRETRLLAIERAGEILFEKRPATGIWAGLWSLPEIAMDADVVTAIRARFGVDAACCEALPPLTHAFTHFTLTMHPARVRVSDWPRRAESPGHAWLTREDAKRAALPAPIRRLLGSL